MTLNKTNMSNVEPTTNGEQASSFTAKESIILLRQKHLKKY
jgi:hypothetical protein